MAWVRGRNAGHRLAINGRHGNLTTSFLVPYLCARDSCLSTRHSFSTFVNCPDALILAPEVPTSSLGERGQTVQSFACLLVGAFGHGRTVQ